MSSFGNNLTWFLDELSNAEPEQFETGAIEIYGENAEGMEGTCDVDVTELAAVAKDRIESLEHALTQALELANRDSEHFGKARSDIVARINETL
jgi:hypothetical protein